ncbi:MAG: class I SAM-dependent methyltransferase [Candidatus Pristimantibacillus lignocellulolyticus]|uniref:Class I SAM-dependent methyltransferase n=1 Tax=Candidatus Pristimantibacillus lignocellulolyticus TaxID=2994561 RepID=A0A9J6Z9L1_9BACL|nr:MAG: class I SAM-dependent methyltransferase [Candidatus Pristimantibacillus lignocellulolyticus]
MDSNQVWKSDLYDKRLSFISEYGKGVVEILNPQEGENILDLGCGTGDLASIIANYGVNVIGMDYSKEMIEKAREKYPHINFEIENGEDFTVKQSFDAVFSNAALHWMKNPEKVLACVWDALSDRGRFVAEFGGYGNVVTIIKSINEVFTEEYGKDATKYNPWYFPTIGEYSTLLEKQGFRVTYAIHFDRPTKLEDGENGLTDWLTSFADNYFADFEEEEKNIIFAKVANKARAELFQNGSWYADYKRIRVMAVKQ